MNKRIILIVTVILCISLVMSAPVAFAAKETDQQLSGNPLLVDQADLLTDQEEAVLLSKLARITDEYEAEVIIVTLTDMDGEFADDYVEYLYDEFGYGYGANRDGVMLMVSMDEREYRILSNGFAADAISLSTIEDIGDMISSDLSDGDYAEAFDEFADQCQYYLNGHLNGFPFEFGTSLIVALVVGLAAGVIVAFILKGQLKSVRKQRQANVYVKSGSMEVTTAHDLYLYRHVTRTQKQSSSSGSGSSRNVGGGRF